ncbi:MAG: hypothetical protein JW709_03805 [Sedimentisphaerales bacterium]|nr:hypothetical protein [Sedimentisphaerales bacterium]
MPQYNNAPAFQLYAGDMLADPVFNRLTMEERGMYFLLLMNLWINGGSLDLRWDNLKRIMRIKSQRKYDVFFAKLKDKFIFHDQILTCPFLTEQIQRHKNYRLTAQKAGRISAEKRRKNATTVERPFNTPNSNFQVPHSKLHTPNSNHHSPNSINNIYNFNNDFKKSNTDTPQADNRDQPTTPQQRSPRPAKVLWLGPPEDDPYRQCSE